MTSKNSFCKLLRHNLSRRMWAMTLALLGSLAGLTLPVAYIIREYYQNAQWLQREVAAYGGTDLAAEQARLLQNAANDVQMVLSLENPFIKLALIVLAILLGVSMFRYLHDKRQVDFYHALPISRGRLFAVQYLTGVAAVLPVYGIVLALTLLAAYGMGFGSALSLGMIGHAIVGNLIFFLLNYTVAVLCTVLTGNTVITVLLGVWAEFGLPLVGALAGGLMSLSFETYCQMPLWQVQLIRLGSPILLYLQAGTSENIMGGFAGYTSLDETAAWSMGAGVLAGALAATIVLGALAYVLFVRRRSERAGTAIAFYPMQEPLQWFLCAAVGLLAGFLFELIMEWIWFGMVLGIVLCHMLVEIIYAFDFKALLHHWKRLIVMLVVLVGATALFRMDLTGYDAYLPARDQIASAGVDLYGSWINSNQYETTYETQMNDADSIDAIYGLAQLGVAGMPSDDDSDMTTVRVRFVLQNGRVVDRIYNRVDFTACKTYVRDLLQNEAYIARNNLLQRAKLPDADAKRVSVAAQLRLNSTGYGESSDAEVRDLEAVRELVETLRAAQLENRVRHLEETPAMRLDLHANWQEADENGEESVYCYTDVENVPIYTSDTKVLTLIERLTGLKPRELTASDVHTLTLRVAEEESFEAAMRERDAYYNGAAPTHTPQAAVTSEVSDPLERFWQEHSVTITDPEAMNALLQGAMTDTVFGMAGMDAQCEQAFDGLHVELTADLVKGEDTNLLYPAGQAPIEVLRSYLV